MKAAVISLGSTSSLMVVEALKKYFTQVDNLQLKSIEVKLGKDGGIFYEGEKLEYYDCMYVKGSFRYAHLLRSIAALLEGKVPYMPITANSFTTVHNKLLTHLVLQQNNIPMPQTYVSPSESEAKDILKRVHYPIVMKFPEGTQGKGVMFADSASSASSLLDALGALRQPFIIQEFIETGGTDIRALVVGDKVIAAMKRTAKTQEVRANIHAGGTGESVILDRETSSLAVATAKALGADICGVDILESPLGPLVIEANASPGLQGLNAASTLDIPDEIAKFLHRKTEESLTSEHSYAARNVMKNIDLVSSNGAYQEIITDLKFRGERIILPEIVNKIALFDERKEYAIKAKKGRIEIEESKV
jgi:ribosomal protein S6--L-glutamate ligase